jgi:hypothetical protein
MSIKFFTLCAAGLLATGAAAFSQNLSSFTSGDLVISTVSNNDPGDANNSLDTASPITLDQFQLSNGGASAALSGSLTLPQSSSGSNWAISGEYGSASEGILQDSVNGQYLTIMGYGVNASVFNTNPSNYGTAALGQTTSLASTTGSTAVPRVVALIGADGSVDTSTALYNIFNGNNPRSVATVDGSSFYVSGQGVTGDSTGGLFYAADGASTATPINNNTTTPTGAQTVSPATGTETRSVEIVNVGGTNTLMASRDYSPSGTPNDATDIRSFVGPTGGLPTSTASLTVSRVLQTATSSLGGNYASINLTTSLENGPNDSRVGKFVYLSPEQFFLASPTVMYVADSGEPKDGSSGAAGLGEGGLQKWVLTSGTWTLDYDLVAGLSLVSNTNANSNTNTAGGVTGLFGLTGQVVDNGSQVDLFATSYGLNELSESYLYEITDTLGDTTISQASGEAFSTLFSGGATTSIRGVAFAPVAVPEPAAWGTMLGGFGLLAAFSSRRRRR